MSEGVPLWEPVCDCSGGMVKVSGHMAGPFHCAVCYEPFVLVLQEPDPGLIAGREHSERMSREAAEYWNREENRGLRDYLDRRKRERDGR